MTYRIRTVSEITGIPRNTLIAWERRYGVVEPARHENGYRSYSEEDVAQLLRIRNAIKAGLKISEAVTLVKQQAGASGAHARPAKTAVDESSLSRFRDELVEALVKYDKSETDRLLAQLMSIPFSARLQEIYFPALRAIGDRWAAGEITVAQEHYASAILRSHFASILVSIGPANTVAPHAACTTFVGDTHEMAALALAIQLSLNGYRVSYLGANLPANELRGFCESQKPQPKLLCVSVINPVTTDELERYAREIAPGLAPATRLVLGGGVLAGLDVEVPEGVEIVPAWENLRS